MTKFSKELGTCHINFLHRISLKGQAIIDFLVELSTEQPKLLSSSTDVNNPNVWTLYVDKLNNMHGNGLDTILGFPEGIQIEHIIHVLY